ncbi:hypothetical protein LVJ85_00735 [Neisseria sp. Dent CA1/247]|uniref:hypothetical protein n=1 Tax=Neisseria sp. Dent CA1/247 TaxID=2912675 RepID=UPI001FD0C374|nr:hypothetical protein [Neisseria sp. Dent CA1/247]UOO77081.1 hypothetical protein LVJ85_00735 [Neisseria sp. Dent CA1/247]
MMLAKLPVRCFGKHSGNIRRIFILVLKCLIMLLGRLKTWRPSERLFQTASLEPKRF